MRLLVLLLLVGAVAHAAPPPANVANVANVAIMPSADGSAAAVRVERELIAAVRALPSLRLAQPGKSNLLTGPPASGPDLVARAQALGRSLGVERVLVADLAPLGDGLVVYLQAIDVASGTASSSASAAISSPAQAELPQADRLRLRGAVAQTLDPSRYVGRLLVRVDVPGAEAVVDGNAPVPAGALRELTVGTHALRVTHPAYRDFLRFLDVEFDHTVTLDVVLSAYPLSEGRMTERRRAQAIVETPPAAPPKRAWRWWVLGAASVVLGAAVATTVFLARPTVTQDRVVDFRH